MGQLKGRVVLEYNKFYNVLANDTLYQCQLEGRFKNEADTQSDLPKVGDWVCIDHTHDASPQIIEIYPRKNEFLRKAKGDALEKDIIATNIDVAFIVMGLNRDFNIHRLERYILLAEGFDVKPVLLFNKLDTCSDLESKKNDLKELLSQYDHFFMSCVTEEGIQEVEDFMKPDVTYIVLGASGVGKSSFINYVLKHDKQLTGDIREKDDRGKHTTRHRELFVLHSGAVIIDTPGIREVQLWETADQLRFLFKDMRPFAAECKFSNCSHSHESFCGVKNAVEVGMYSARRYAHYAMLLKEIEVLDNKKKQHTKYLKQVKKRRKT